MYQWFSGRIQRCHRWAPRSICGWRMTWWTACCTTHHVEVLAIAQLVERWTVVLIPLLKVIHRSLVWFRFARYFLREALSWRAQTCFVKMKDASESLIGSHPLVKGSIRAFEIVLITSLEDVLWSLVWFRFTLLWLTISYVFGESTFAPTAFFVLRISFLYWSRVVDCTDSFVESHQSVTGSILVREIVFDHVALYVTNTLLSEMTFFMPYIWFLR